MINIIKKRVPKALKVQINTFINSKEITLPPGNKAFIFLAADYGNIGDIAITRAQHNFLNNNLTDYEVVSIPISQTRLVINSIKKQIQAADIVTIIGGGNMGGIYPDIEALRQLVIKSFPKNRIVCFPQTLDWDNTRASKKALKRIAVKYAKHPDIHIFARESVTYQQLLNVFKKQKMVSFGLVPDIVLSSSAQQLRASHVDSTTKDTPHILQCLREDKEAVLTKPEHRTIAKALKATGLKVIKTDTHAGGNHLDKVYCAQLLSTKINQFRSAEMVVTDRLHGMIMCLLAGTPCLVLPNSNHKISQTYADWLENHPRLIFIRSDQLHGIDTYIDILLSTPHGSTTESPISIEKYRPLIEALTL